MALTPEQHQEIRGLHADGCGRNEIARRTGIAPVMVSKAAEKMGLSFDRSKIQAATTARLADLAEMRSLTAHKLHIAGDKLLDKVFKPARVFSFGGKENVYAEEWHDEPPASDKRSLVSAAATAFDRSLKMAPPEQTAGVDAAKSMLGGLSEALQEFVRNEDELAEHEQGDGEA
ncbi:hypothetical protein [Streptomyces sp. NPDC088258]|uniref:hypothetical protein n=1 Tax=Streptomyces sp. NPDC088258 TaxID=3365849 RepID=UPI003827C46C